jgi:hypothetical protein
MEKGIKYFGGPERIRTAGLFRDREACWATTPRVLKSLLTVADSSSCVNDATARIVCQPQQLSRYSLKRNR